VALISAFLGWAGLGTIVPENLFGYALASLLAALLLRVPLEIELRRHGPTTGRMLALYAVHLVLTAVATLLNPLACIYAFIGYVDIQRLLRGWWAVPILPLTAAITASGQAGGVGGVIAVPWLFAALFGVNLIIAGTMTTMAIRQDRAMDERERAVAELEDVTRRNAALQDELVDSAREAGQMHERARLAREMHDTVSQGLVGVIRQLDAVPEPADTADAEHLAQARAAAQLSLTEMRRAVRALAPSELEDLEMPEALEDLAARWARLHRIPVTVDVDDALSGGGHQDVLVRATQEGLSNAARHADPSSVEITLVSHRDRDVLTVRDDGSGFDPAPADPAHGLGFMTSRVEEVGGTLRVDSTPGSGTMLRIEVPR
jgi:signal transduction histidine kinase